MSNEHLVDAEILPAVRALPPLHFSARDLPAVRSMIDEFLIIEANLPPESSVDVETVMVQRDEPAGSIRVLLYRPAGLPGARPAILHIHGGGYVVGKPELMDGVNREISVALGCVIASVDYRLAPETPAPGGVVDCYTVLQWLSANAGSLGIDAARIGVKGESAGGGLAAALTLLVRDKGEVSLAFQHLIYPMLDDRTCVAAPNRFAGDFSWTRENNRFGWSSQLGGEPGAASVPPYAVPARAENLAGLPPAFISVGALDLFVDEDIDYAHRLIRAGVPVELHVYPGGPHGFDNVPGARIAQGGKNASIAALRRAMYG